MQPTHRPGRRALVGAEVVTLVGFVLLVPPGGLRPVGAVVMVLGALAVLVCAAVRLRATPQGRGAVVTAAASAVGLVGSVTYLRSLADEPAAIPLAGVGVLLVSFVGLVATATVLATRRDPAVR